MLACLYGIPVLAITWSDPGARYFCLMILSFICSMSVLGLIFIPKVIFHRRGGFKKASRIVARQAIVTSSQFSESNVDGNEAFVSGLSRWDSTVGDHSSTEEGIRIVDGPNVRDSLKQQNTELRERDKVLMERVKKLEGMSRRNLI